MKEVTEEGEVIPFQQSDLECGSESNGSNDRILVILPTNLTLFDKNFAQLKIFKLKSKDAV